jgi:hypothetical protein
MSKTSKPVTKISMFPVTAAIWENRTDGKSYYSVTFQRSYRDDKGNWQNSDSFGTADLLLLAKVADQAHSEIHKLRGANRAGQQSEDESAPSDE